MRYDIFKNTALAMPKPAKGTEFCGNSRDRYSLRECGDAILFLLSAFHKIASTFHGQVLNALCMGVCAGDRAVQPFHFAITEPPLSYA